MKKLLTALATAATAALGFAEIAGTEGFEDSSCTAYDNDKPVQAAAYPFDGYGDRYRSLDDDGEVELLANDASCVDAVMQFKYADVPDEFDGDVKLVVFANSDGKLVVVDANATNVTTTAITEDTWYRLTIVSVDETVNDATIKKFKVYVNGDSVATEGGVASFTSRVANSYSVTKMTLSGTGKVDNFVARTTDPFVTPASVVAKIGSEQFETYAEALSDALKIGKAVMILDGNVVVDGSSDAPYQIPDVASLKALQKAVAAGYGADKCYVQTADIDMTEAGAFAGIGVYAANPTAGTPFTGTYDGGNFKISNVTMTGRNYGGIFNQVNGGTIKNLTVENISTEATSGEFGYAIVGNAGNGATLENLTAAGSFLSSKTPATHNAAGIVVRVCGGGENGTLIKNCTNNAAIYGAYTKLGGICAIAQHKVGSTPVTFQNCSNTGALDISYVNEKEDATGFAGILAYSADDAVLEGCSNTGTLTNSGETENDYVKGALVGNVPTKKLTLKSAIASGDIGKFNAGCTVALDFNVSGNNVDFNLYGAPGSTVELLQDFTGYPSQNAVIDPALKLSANMTINNGWSYETNATFTAISGTGTLTVSHPYNYVKYYRINKLDGFTGTLASGQPQVYFVIDDIVATETPAYGTAVVKGGSSLKVYDLASTTLGGVAADLCVDTLDNQNGIYLVAAQVVADDESTTDYASVENALAAADAAYAATVNVLDPDAVEVEKTGWSYDNRVYTSTRAIATLKGTTYPSLTKALAAAAEDDEVVLVGATSESVTIPAGVTVAVADNVAFNGTVAGAGTVKYTAAQTGTIKFGEWTGTVTLDWAGIVNANDIAPVVEKYGKAGSTVEIGPNGTITGDSYFNSNPVVTLKVSGFVSINNGSSGAAGKRTIPTVTGDGVLVFGTKGAMVNYAIDNVVDWNGVITNSASATLITNLVSGSGTVVYKAAAAAMKIGDEFDGEVEYAVSPSAAPVVGANSEATVYMNFNYAGMNIAPYGKTNSTIKLGNLTAANAYFNDGNGNGTGLISSKVVVAGDVTINNAWPLGSADWTSTKVVRFGNRLKVDGSLTFASTRSSWTGYGYYRADVLDASGAGSITVGNRFALRIDAVDFAEAPSGTDALVDLTLAGDTPGLLYGPNGVVGEQIPVTVNGEATEQSLVYDATKGGLVLYVAPTYAATDSTGRGYDSVAEAIATVYSLYPAQGSVVNVLDEEFTDTGMWNDYFTWNSETRVYTLREFVAAIGTAKYATLAKALEEAMGGDTIQLLADITLGAGDGAVVFPAKTLSLNLNGHAIQRLANSYYVLDIPSGAEVTILDATGTTGMIKGTPVASGNTTNPASLIRLKGKLTLASGSLVSDYTCVKVDEDPGVGEFVMNGGTLEVIANDKGYTGLTFTIMNWGVATINGGTHKGNVQSLSYSGNNASKSSTLTINGGSFDPANVYLIPFDTTYAPTVKIVSTIDNLTVVNAGDASLNWEVKNLADETVADKTYKVYSLSQIPQGFPGGADGKTFTIDGEVTLPAGTALTDTASAATGLTYAQAAVLGLLDEDGALKKDVTPTIEVKDGKVVVSLDGTTVDSTRYTVMLNVFEKASLEAKWPETPAQSYKLGSKAEAAGFTPSSAAAGFYKVGVTIEDAQ